MHGRRTDPEQLRELIAQRQMTLKEFCEATGLSRTHLHYVLTEQRGLSDRAAVRVAQVLGVAITDFTRPGRLIPPKRRSPQADGGTAA